MGRYSTLARMQQAITLGLLGSGAAWLLWWWPESPLRAVAGMLFILFGYSAFLAFEFTLLRWAGRDDPAPRPTWPQLARAWWGETLHGPLVFCWRQPFRWQAVPDHLALSTRGRRGVVFIHGFVCNRGLWNPWLARVRAMDRAFVAVNLEPVFGSIEDYVPIVEDAVARVTVASGMPPLVVCHSMGGLAARAWLRAKGRPGRVHRVVTIGTPHHGTWLGRFSHLTNGRQMRLRSEWLQELARHVPEEGTAAFTCWYSNCDNIVFPASTATLPDEDNRLVAGAAHVQLAFVSQVVEGTLALLDAAQ